MIGRSIHVPTLLVRAGDSDVVDDAGVENMRNLIPQTEVHVVQGAAHMVAGDNNDAFNSGILTFLDRHLSSG